MWALYKTTPTWSCNILEALGAKLIVVLPVPDIDYKGISIWQLLPPADATWSTHHLLTVCSLPPAYPSSQQRLEVPAGPDWQSVGSGKCQRGCCMVP
ncbi:hypothetical protein XELAEV_18042826mg [Xenopus laevis]|uniref:Uncharacterized protein n=1 Tax=Xenopus laevis TaxID=8355 RepID=A0A974H6E9_XENLA|nr:hypothetical protein XELAEV_18042826mg [Xenopus laevis]